MEKKYLAFVLSAVSMCIYIALVLFLFFAVVRVDRLANFGAAMTFQCFGFAILALFIFLGILQKPLKTGYFVPLLIVTIVYVIILNALCLALITIISHTLFMLLNLVLLFVYSVISIPMYVMGKK